MSPKIYEILNNSQFANRQKDVLTWNPSWWQPEDFLKNLDFFLFGGGEVKIITNENFNRVVLSMFNHDKIRQGNVYLYYSFYKFRCNI